MGGVSLFKTSVSSSIRQVGWTRLVISQWARASQFPKSVVRCGSGFSQCLGWWLLIEYSGRRAGGVNVPQGVQSGIRNCPRPVILPKTLGFMRSTVQHALQCTVLQKTRWDVHTEPAGRQREWFVLRNWLRKTSKSTSCPLVNCREAEVAILSLKAAGSRIPSSVRELPSLLIQLIDHISPTQCTADFTLSPLSSTHFANFIASSSFLCGQTTGHYSLAKQTHKCSHGARFWRNV